MLTGDEIRAGGFVQSPDEMGFRPASYDVAIGRIILPNGSVAESHVLPAQGIVQVVSRERVVLPRDVSGVATVKTSLCNTGVLALSIGIVDPGYDGPVSSFLINFSSQPQLLSAGDRFLRIQFIRHGNVSDSKSRPVDMDSYIAERRRQAVRTGSTFLNLGMVIEESTNRVFREWRTRILAYAGSASVALALLTFLINLGSLQVVKGWLQPSDTVRADLLRSMLIDQNAKLAKANEELAVRVTALEAAMIPPKPPPARPPSPHP